MFSQLVTTRHDPSDGSRDWSQVRKRCKNKRRKRAPRRSRIDPLGLRQDGGPPSFGDDLGGDLADMVGEISLFAGCESIPAARTILRDQIKLEVEAMAALVRDADAFDVIELMRLRELGVVPQAA